MTDDPTIDSPAGEARSPEPVLKPSKVTRARVTASGTATGARPRAATTKPAATPEPRPEPDRPTTVSIVQGGIERATADAIDIHQGGIGRATAKDIAVSSGGIGYAHGERVSVEMGGIGLVHAPGEARLTQGGAGLVVARDVTIDQSLISTLVADRVTIRQPSAVLVLIARQVDGTVRPLLDWRGAIVAGAVAGVLIGLIRRGRR
jgi:hypothetical protein